MKRSPLRRQSKKRAKEAPVRRRIVTDALERANYTCQARHLVPHVACWGPLDVDEYELRSARPGGHLDPENVQVLCRVCHDFKHQEELHSAILGLRQPTALYREWMLSESGPTEGAVRDALRALAAFKARAVPDHRMPSDSDFARIVPDALRAAEAGWRDWLTGTDDSGRHEHPMDAAAVGLRPYPAMKGPTT